MESINPKLFDIVIPIGPNDITVCRNQIKYTKLNVVGYRNIYIVSFDPTFKSNNCITINEDIFPFTKQDIVKYHGNTTRQGWYLQQLIKLYAGIVIPGILEKYLVIDADTLFLKPTTFIENDICLYNFGVEYHMPYFKHMLNLDKELTKVFKNISGICHHMIFETKYINELISKIEKNHNDFFYNIFLKLVNDKSESGASEYEIYFNYMLKNHNDKIKIRKLNWKNSNKIITDENLDYISCHWYLR